MSALTRRHLLQVLPVAALAGCATPGRARARVLVVGGGYGGATAARYLRLLSGGSLEVVMVEPEARFVSCPLSNLVLGGSRSLAELSRGYEALATRHGVQVVQDHVAALDAEGRRARLASGAEIRFDRAVLSPGVELQLGRIEGLAAAQSTGRVLQAWKAGPETLALRRQLEEMPDGGVYAITVPEAPYRCPPGPYERACQVASYFSIAKPRAKVLILDANPEPTSKAALFRRVWAEQYRGMVEYRPDHKLLAVDAARGMLRFELAEDVRADVLNVLPPMRAGRLAVDAGLANSNGRWCGVHYRSFESTAAPAVHVVGDAIQVSPAMPKSGHMANAHAKVAAAAIVAELNGWAPDPAPMLTNTCYSYVDADNVIHVASVHRYLEAERNYRVVEGSGGVSTSPNETEGRYAWSWARTIWADMLG